MNQMMNIEISDTGTKVIYPCRCGQNHERIEDRNHHECFHRSPLVLLDELDDPFQQLMCMDCGEVFDLDGKLKRQTGGRDGGGAE